MRRSVEIQPCSIRFVIHRKFILPLGSFYSLLLFTGAGRFSGLAPPTFTALGILQSLRLGGPLFCVRGFQSGILQREPTSKGIPRASRTGGPLFCVRGFQRDCAQIEKLFKYREVAGPDRPSKCIGCRVTGGFDPEIRVPKNLKVGRRRLGLEPPSSQLMRS